MPDENGLVGIAVSYDMAWQRRNGGHSSNTGHGAVMGITTGKVLDYGTRTKLCRVCNNVSAGQTPRPHDCRKNHVGSSKSMEPNVAVDLFQRATSSGVKYNVYTGDDDTTTQSHIRQQVSYEVEKQSDTIHTKRSLMSKLYTLKEKQKFPGCSTLSAKVISYLGNCFGYCIAQNKGNEQLLQAGIRNIVPHAFGKHQKCNESWCRYQRGPDSYKHNDLPFGKDLHGDELEKALTQVFDDYSTDIVVKKLAPATNSQRNEALNSVVGSKNPKTRYYGSSESNDFRVACGVSQCNDGYIYVPEALENIGVEAGPHCTKHCKEMDKKSQKDKVRKSSLQYKRKRANQNRNKLARNARNEGKEGPTYMTGIGLNLDPTSRNASTDVLQLTKNTSKQMLQDYEKLVPTFVQRPKQSTVAFNNNTTFEFVMFDLETTTIGKKAEICQLSAVKKDGKLFNEYVLPEGSISERASRVNKLTVKTNANNQRVLCHDGTQVMSVSVEQCLNNFIAFLSVSPAASTTVLIGHNATVFDTPTLLRSGGRSFADKLSMQNIVFADSLPLARTLLKARHPSLIQANNNLCKTDLSSLYQCLFNDQFNAHDALEDVKALRRILFSSSLKLTDAEIVEKGNPRSAIFAFEDMKFLDDRHRRAQTFCGNLYTSGTDDGLVKFRVLQKIAEGGLCYNDLKNLFKKAGRAGLVAILAMAPSAAFSSRSPRGSRNENTLMAIIRHFEGQNCD